MKKHVETVAKDIQELLAGVRTGTHKVEFDSNELLAKFGTSVAKTFKKSLVVEEKVRPPLTFYASEIGSKCYRQLWYKYHKPELGEPVSASMSMKFMYGGIIEEVVLRLAELAGHKVEYEQESIEFTDSKTGIVVRGRIDAIMDGEAVVDVKSTSSYGFKDFKAGVGGNKFGYAEQLDFYGKGLRVKGLLPHYYKMGFIAVDKQLGHILYAPLTGNHTTSALLDDLNMVVTNKVTPPFTRLPTVTEGSNQKLGMECSYCSYKQECWKDANGGKGLRAFGYAGKVVWLTEVKKEPRVPEITVISGDDGDGLIS